MTIDPMTISTAAPATSWPMPAPCCRPCRHCPSRYHPHCPERPRWQWPDPAPWYVPPPWSPARPDVVWC